MFQQQPWMQQGPVIPQGQGGGITQAQNNIMPAQQFPPSQPPVPGFAIQSTQLPESGMLPLEQSFIENILRLNKGKVASFYMTYENNSEWNAKVFRGVVEEAGRDHIIVSDLEAGKYYLLLMVTLDYVVFDEPIQYQRPIFNPQPLATYSPR